MLVIGVLEGDRMSDGAWGRGVLVSVVVGGDRTPEGMVAGAAPLSVLGCDGEMGGVLGGWGGRQNTGRDESRGSPLFAPFYLSRLSRRGAGWLRVWLRGLFGGGWLFRGCCCVF